MEIYLDLLRNKIADKRANTRPLRSNVQRSEFGLGLRLKYRFLHAHCHRGDHARPDV